MRVRVGVFFVFVGILLNEAQATRITDAQASPVMEDNALLSAFLFASAFPAGPEEEKRVVGRPRQNREACESLVGLEEQGDGKVSTSTPRHETTAQPAAETTTTTLTVSRDEQRLPHRRLSHLGPPGLARDEAHHLVAVSAGGDLGIRDDDRLIG